MSFPWPVTDNELVLDEALDIAMRSFDLPQHEEHGRSSASQRQLNLRYKPQVR
jgi:hypothetical protein